MDENLFQKNEKRKTKISWKFYLRKTENETKSPKIGEKRKTKKFGYRKIWYTKL